MFQLFPVRNLTLSSEIASDEDNVFFTDEFLISLALIQLPAVVLAVLGVAKAFHKHGCSCDGLLGVFKASLLAFTPFFVLELVSSVGKLHDLCLPVGLIPCSHMIQKINRVRPHSKPFIQRLILKRFTYFRLTHSKVPYLAPKRELHQQMAIDLLRVFFGSALQLTVQVQST